MFITNGFVLLTSGMIWSVNCWGLSDWICSEERLNLESVFELTGRCYIFLNYLLIWGIEIDKCRMELFEKGWILKMNFKI